jgi:hypothetical protein
MPFGDTQTGQSRLSVPDELPELSLSKSDTDVAGCAGLQNHTDDRVWTTSWAWYAVPAWSTGVQKIASFTT